MDDLGQIVVVDDRERQHQLTTALRARRQQVCFGTECGADPNRALLWQPILRQYGPTLLSQAEQAIEDVWWTGEVRSSAASRVVRIVSAGRLNQEKGFHLLIQAIARLKQLHPENEFRTALLGEGSRRAALEQQVSELDLSDVVHLPGFQDNATAWFRSANVFVLPSLIEGMPNVLLEAMACGTAVVASNCHSGPAEILRDGEFGELVTVNDAAALQAGIERILANTRLAASRAEAAQAEIEQNWSVQAATRRLEQILATATEMTSTSTTHKRVVW